MLDGLFDLPEGKLAALVTYLQRNLADPIGAVGMPDGFRLERLGGRATGRYRALFAAVGAEWLWFSRLRLDEDALGAILGDPLVEAHALIGPDGECGLLELDFRDAALPELAFFGLVAAHVGRGLGRALMAEALLRAKAAGHRRLFVHTCSLDHPAALAFYVKTGFRPFRRAIEVFDDPRLDGTLPRNVAAFMPPIET